MRQRVPIAIPRSSWQEVGQLAESIAELPPVPASTVRAVRQTPSGGGPIGRRVTDAAVRVFILTDSPFSGANASRL